MSNTVTPTPIDCVDFVLYSSPNHEPDHDFYLRIPISFIEDHYTRPMKFLFYLGWCILGITGDIFRGEERIVLLDAEHMQLQPGERYYYRPENDDDVFKYAVDMTVIKPKSERSNSSQGTGIDANFMKRLLERDGACLFTGSSHADGIHIIFQSKGDDWIQHIVDKRPNDDVEADLKDVDDVRNGMLADCSITSRLFESRDAIIIKTPNRILSEDDVAPRCERELEDDTSYPTGVRYTFQYLKPPQRKSTLRFAPDNNDAGFPKTPSAIWSKPSGLLLNYNFGAAAVHHWGQNRDLFENRPGIQRPEVKDGPQKTNKKRKLLGGQQDNGEETNEWDADDIMMFFWAKSKAARERQEREEQNLRKSIEDWKSSVK